MRLYTLNKRHFAVVSIIFVICFTATVLIGLSGPDVMEFTRHNASSLVASPENIKRGPFVIKSPTLSSFNQQIWLTARLNISSNLGSRYEVPLSIAVQVRGLIEDDDGISSDVVYGKQLSNHSHLLRCTVEVTFSVTFGFTAINVLTYVKPFKQNIFEGFCQSLMQDCEEIIILYLGYVSNPHYIITIYMYGIDKVKLDDMIFTFTRYNAAFTEFEIWMRFAFLIMAFLTTVGWFYIPKMSFLHKPQSFAFSDLRNLSSMFLINCWFAHSLRKFAINDWSIEQKWMIVLLPLLLLYNDPLFPLSFLVNSSIPSVLDTVFQDTFFTSLLLYWLCVYHGVRQTRRRILSFYVPKVMLVGILWLLIVVLSLWQPFKQVQDPTHDFTFDTNYALGVKISFAVIGALYVAYLFFLLVRAYSELRGMPYLDLRLKFMTALMLLVLGISFTIILLRFGIKPLWSDNFIPELSTHYHNSAMFAAFYGLLNFYMLTMAYVYSPSKNAVYESHLKDNPGLSMVNDSDEEVVYGSEETSLTRKTPASKYDSDEEAFN